jgi:hypothetical protein
MNSKIKNLLSLAFTGGYAVNLKAFNSRNKPHNTSVMLEATKNTR